MSNIVLGKKKLRWWIFSGIFILTLLTFGYLVVWRRVRNALVLVRCANAEFWVADQRVKTRSQLLGLDGLRVILETPSTIALTAPRDRGDVARLGIWSSVPQLVISAERLTDEDLLPLSEMGSLEGLQVEGGNGLNGAFLRAIQHPERLKRLIMKNSGFANANAHFIAQMTDLEHLSLPGTPLSDRGVYAFGDLSNIKYLDLSRTCITGKSIELIKDMQELEVLLLSNTSVKGADLYGIGSLRNLQQLFVIGIIADAKDLTFIQKLGKLHLLHCTVIVSDLQAALAVFRKKNLDGIGIVTRSAVDATVKATYDEHLDYPVWWSIDRSMMDTKDRQSD